MVAEAQRRSDLLRLLRRTAEVKRAPLQGAHVGGARAPLSLSNCCRASIAAGDAIFWIRKTGRPTMPKDRASSWEQPAHRPVLREMLFPTSSNIESSLAAVSRTSG